MDAGHERDLVRRCREGDDKAFQELVDEYRRRVFGLIFRFVGDPARAEDLAQEVFLRVHRGLPYFRGEARLSTWIYRIVVNVCTQSRAGSPPLESLDDDHEPREIVSVDRRFTDMELRDRLEKAMGRLRPQYRLLVASHYLEGIRYEDLAEALDLPLGTIKTHLHRARRQLRRWLETDLK
jgi:RNA polymerase sigma-70 factor (ECF subfamily)